MACSRPMSSPHGPQRIVCLTEETTEWLYLLGEESRIVGISGYTVRPKRARQEKPRVSAFLDGKIDRIAELQPDLVIGFSDMQAALAAELVAATRQALQRHLPADADAARLAPPLVGFSVPMRQAGTELKRFLFEALYRHAQVRASMERARQVVTELFAAYVQRPDEMPTEHMAQPQRERAVADYIAGMTDRFALREHQRLTGRVLFAAVA